MWCLSSDPKNYAFDTNIGCFQQLLPFPIPTGSVLSQIVSLQRFTNGTGLIIPLLLDSIYFAQQNNFLLNFQRIPDICDFRALVTKRQPSNERH